MHCHKLPYVNKFRGIATMAMLTIRNLDDETKGCLRMQAAIHGCSMEEEARQILREALSVKQPQRGLASRIHQKVMKTTGGVELELPHRSVPRPPPDFSGDNS
jgi:plasmid stability protein